MIIKRYIVNNMNEAMTRIRYELGKDAVIISQRKIKKGGFLGFFCKRVLEVTAAMDNKNSSSGRKNNEDIQDSIQAIKRIMNKNSTKNAYNDTEKNESLNNNTRTKVIFDENYKTMLDKNNSELIGEVKEMRNMLDEIMKKSPVSLGKSKLQLYLEQIDIEDKYVMQIVNEIKKMPDTMPEKEKIKESLKNMLSVKPIDMSNTMVLIGPTGVGKTTTIAKLAGRMALVEKKKIGLITIDTYRIGAVEQLKTYADIMNIPFKVVLNIKEMQMAIESMKDCDLILIDTTGRSSKNKMQIFELRAFIEKANTTNIHLVISATTKNRDIDIITEGYKPLNYDNVIITKLDETSTYGSIVNICNKTGKPISFVTTGQNVPDDIKIMNSEELTNLVLGEDII